MLARKTEYKGTVYRSKSEAMFAASLDYNGLQSVYEPSWLAFDGWTPDFAIPSFDGAFHFYVVEYKPCSVTHTYIQDLCRRFLLLHKQAKNAPPYECMLVTCDWFNDSTSTTILEIRRDGSIVQLTKEYAPSFFTNESREYARNYRFDLEHNRQQVGNELDFMIRMNQLRSSYRAG